MITGQNLKKTFSGRMIFSRADIVIPDGEIVGLYGNSGIGKSTLAKLLCGILKPEEGQVYLDDSLLVSADHAYDRKKGLAIQMVYQQPYSSLDPGQKLIQGFRELIRYHHFADTPSEEEQLLDEVIRKVDLDFGILHHLPRQISGGEAQRAAIARCLLFHPRLLILDEATSMLDVSTQANIYALVRQIAENDNCSVLLISHDKALVNHLCSQIFVFENQTIKEKKEV